MKFSGNMSRIQHRDYIQDSLEYLSFNSHIFENRTAPCSPFKNSYHDEVVCLGEIDGDKEHLINDTITLDDSQILSEVEENYSNDQNTSKSLNKVGVTIIIDDSFTTIDEIKEK